MPTYENKVLTGDKLYTLVSLIKGELANKVAVSDLPNVPDAIDDYFDDQGITIGLNTINIEATDSDTEFSSSMGGDGLATRLSIAGDIEQNATYTPQEATLTMKDIVNEVYNEGVYSAGGFGISIDEYDSQNKEIGDLLASFDISAEADGTIQMSSQGGAGGPIPVMLNGETLATFENIISELGGYPGIDTLGTIIARTPELNAKQDVLVFNTAYNASSNKVATMSDVSGKQDALVFNTAYNASSNKVATMSDIPDISGKQDALVFNTAYNASSNKVATMADIPSVSAFQTASDVQSAITSAISGITSFGFQVVSTLPASNISETTIYLVLKSSGASGNIYTEYAWVKTGTDSITGEDTYGWETLGDTAVSIETLSTAEVNSIWNSAEAQ